MKVYVTGTGSITSLGHNVDSMFDALLEGRTGVELMPDWQKFNGLNCHVGAPVKNLDTSRIPRQVRRSMSKMAEMAALSAQQALTQAQFPETELQSSRGILIAGSTTGSPETMETYFKKLFERGGPEGQLSTSFFKIMNHSVPANVAAAIGFNGALLSPSSACATSNQAVIQGWELIRSGLYDWALVGGADELHHTSAAIFDIVFAASRGFSHNPDLTPRPFDKRRDGLVVSEGSGFLLLESESFAQKRGARPLAEIVGGAYMCDSSHMTQSSQTTMTKVMFEALKRAQMTPSQVDYVNAHATGTLQGDYAEAAAVGEVFGRNTPVSSLKGHFGHTLAACGAIEAIMSMKMMETGKLIPTRNLDDIDPECLQVCHLQKVTDLKPRLVMSNNFAFGGVAASLLVASV